MPEVLLLKLKEMAKDRYTTHSELIRRILLTEIEKTEKEKKI